MTIDIRIDDLTSDATHALIAAHLSGMHESSPPESVHALDADSLRDPSVTFWSAWIDGTIAGIGALKSLDAERGELKSMRVADGFLGMGVGRALLRHIVDEARDRGMTSLWLETGSTRGFPPGAAALRERGVRRVWTVRRVRLRPVLDLHDPDAVASSLTQARAAPRRTPRHLRPRP